MKLDLIRQLIESGVSWEQVAQLETDSTQDTETVVVSEKFEEKSKETETEQKEVSANIEESFNKMMDNFANKLEEMNNKLSSFNQRFGEIEKRNLNERTTDDILAEILMPNGDKIIRGDK